MPEQQQHTPVNAQDHTVTGPFYDPNIIRSSHAYCTLNPTCAYHTKLVFPSSAIPSSVAARKAFVLLRWSWSSDREVCYHGTGP